MSNRFYFSLCLCLSFELMIQPKAGQILLGIFHKSSHKVFFFWFFSFLLMCFLQAYHFCFLKKKKKCFPKKWNQFHKHRCKQQHKLWSVVSMYKLFSFDPDIFMKKWLTHSKQPRELKAGAKVIACCPWL